MSLSDTENKHEKPLVELDHVIIRFAGDSGDGMQLTGTQFSHTSAILGNTISTLPDYPAEIRAPAGSIPGVSGFQINLGSHHDIRTPGDEPNVLVAMNPAALKVNLSDLEKGGIILVNSDAFTETNLKKAKYPQNPIEDGSLAGYRVISLPLAELTTNALKSLNLSRKEVERYKNFFALGIMYWLFDRPLAPTLKWIEEKFLNKETVGSANSQALKAGYYYADTTELFTTHFRVPKAADLKPGRYRNLTGNEATALGFVAASLLAKVPLFYASYPITPASEILHELSRLKNYGVKTFQAEDEIAAMSAAIGAAYAGQLGLTGTSGPGLALKSEAIGLAVMTELPVVIANIQRGGPSTGLPTKTEQSDLFQALFGRNGESPVAVVAPASPGDCFSMAFEAFRIAVHFMTPVIFLSDGYLANGSEPLLIPSIEELPNIDVQFWTDPNGFQPYLRNEKTLARPWAVPGTPGLEHRIGGLEKQHIYGNVSYNPDNHEFMVKMRAAKIERIANDIPDIEVFGKPQGKVLVVGWGSTYGAITSAVEFLQNKGKSVSSIHLRYLNPFPKNLGEILSRFEKILVAELNLGQLQFILRGQYLVNALGYHKIKGMPFKISEIVNKIEELL